MSDNIFTPVGTTKNITAASATSAVALPVFASTATSVMGSRTVRVFNGTAVVVFIEFGISTVTAAVATSMPIAPGAVEYLEVGPGVTHVAGITSAGGGTVHFTEGRGD
jgi:hypothetical protein